MIIYLYKKTHNTTGLKYLGKTTKNPHTYMGSGKMWLRHIKKYGNNISTEIIFQTEDIDEFRRFSLEYSIKNDIVNSIEWANLILETGTGGDNPHSYTDHAKKKSKDTRKMNNKTWKQTQISNEKRSASHINYWNSESAFHRKSKKTDFIGPPKPKGFILNNDRSIMCPHCETVGQYRNMKRWHLDRCKMNSDRINDMDFGNICCINCKQEKKVSPNFFLYHGSNCRYVHNP
jgi:hypothetical protein